MGGSFNLVVVRIANKLILIFLRVISSGHVPSKKVSIQSNLVLRLSLFLKTKLIFGGSKL